MKYCPKCGHSNEDTVNYCSECGTALGEAQTAPAPDAPVPPVPPVFTGTAPEAPQAGSYVTDYNNAYNTSASGQVPAAPVSNDATLWLILNIVLTVLCCGNIANIIGIVFAALGMGAFNRGDYTQMASNVKVSKILFFVGLGLGLLTVIGVVVAIAAGGLASFFDYGYGY